MIYPDFQFSKKISPKYNDYLNELISKIKNHNHISNYIVNRTKLFLENLDLDSVKIEYKWENFLPALEPNINLTKENLNRKY